MLAALWEAATCLLARSIGCGLYPQLVSLARRSSHPRPSARHDQSDEQHQRDLDLGCLMLPQGADEPDSTWRAADYRTDTEAGLRPGLRPSPQIRHKRARGTPETKQSERRSRC